MTSLQRMLVRVCAFLLLAFLSLACCLGDCDPVPDRNTCSDGAETASLTGFRFLDDDPRFSQSGFVTGGQGSEMLTARFVFEGDDIPDCATVAVSAETIGGARVVWTETAALETEDHPMGGRQSKGTMFRVFEPSTPEDCVVRITATAYGQTAEFITESTSFRCDEPADAGLEDDAGVTDAGSDASSGPTDAGR